MNDDTESSPPPTLKVLVVGDTKGGSTALVKRGAFNIYENAYKPTTFVDCVTIESTKPPLQLWDIVRQERFTNLMMRVYYQESTAAIVVADAQKLAEGKETGIAEWVEKLDDKAPRTSDDTPIPRILVVTKEDLITDKDALDRETATLLNNPDYAFKAAYVTSSKDNTCHQIDKEGNRKNPANVRALFTDVAKIIAPSTQMPEEISPQNTAVPRVKQSATLRKLSQKNVHQYILNALVGFAVICILIVGITIAAIVAGNPLTFLGFSGALSIAVSVLFVLEITAAVCLGTSLITTPGQRVGKYILNFLKNALRVVSGAELGGAASSPRLLLNYKIWMVGISLLVVGVLLIAMLPGGILATPLFTAATAGGSVVLVIATLATLLVAMMVVERVIALITTWGINRGTMSATTPKSHFNSWPKWLKTLGIEIVADVVGKSPEVITTKQPVPYQLFPAMIASAWKDSEDSGPEPEAFF